MGALTSAHSSHAWLVMFAGRLKESRSTASIATAVRCAAANIHDAADLDPTVAVNCSAEAHSRASAGQAAIAMAPQSMRNQAMFGGSANDPSGS